MFQVSLTKRLMQMAGIIERISKGLMGTNVFTEKEILVVEGSGPGQD
jgi:hypothetical protein